MNERILIIDDEPEILELLEPILTDEGFAVQKALSGGEAIRIFKTETFDLVITDMKMLGMDGLAVVREAKRLAEDVEIIVLTGYATMENAIQALKDGGAYDYLTKPLEDIDALLLSVNRALEKRGLMLSNNRLKNELRAHQVELEMQNEELRTTQSELRSSRDRYRTLVDTMNEGLVEVDEDWRITFMNDRFAEMMGHSRDRLMGRWFHEFVSEAYKAKVQEEHARRRQGETGKYELELVRGDGEKIFVFCSPRPFYDSEGNYLGSLGVVADITMLKAAEEALLKARKLESLGVFAGGIAHDFNNLMTAVLGNISLTRMNLKPESKALDEYLIEAEKASIETKALTARLITFAKGGGPIKKSVRMGDLVKNAVGASLKRSDICCRFSIPGDILPVAVDEEQMKQVIRNIVTNAKEAMAGQGSIHVSFENVNIGEKDPLTLKDGPYVKISLRDQGPGIPGEDLVRIFDPYFSTKEMGTQKGMGLGLAVSDSIVKKHDGIITVASELGKGTTLSIYLPASECPESKAPGAQRNDVGLQSPINNRQSTIQRILVMDDEEKVREVTDRLLTHLGYEVEVAVEGFEAIERYGKAMESEKPFDMVILDLTNKIGMGGVEAIVRLLEIDPDVKAIVATGYTNDPIISNFREHGFRGIIPKPFGLEELRSTLCDAGSIV